MNSNNHSFMPEPSRTQFETYEGLVEYAMTFAKENGYALVTKRTRKDKAGFIKHIDLKCDLGGHYHNRCGLTEENRKRKSSTKLIGCPFGWKGCRRAGIWYLEVCNNSHNHEPSTTLSGHAKAHRLTLRHQERVEQMTAAGIRPREILSSLMLEDPTIILSARTIYNARNRIRLSRMSEMTSIHTLVNRLPENEYKFSTQLDADRQVTRFFIAPNESITLTRKYPYVFRMEPTYKNRRFRMPLLEVIGITSQNTMFCSCFVFLKEEKEEDYAWALLQMKQHLFDGLQMPAVIVTDRGPALMTAIERQWPESANVLCQWHIEKDVLARCRKHFAFEEDWLTFMGMWRAIVKSVTVEQFLQQWEKLVIACGSKPDVLAYLQQTWLPHKEQFVVTWTKQWMHLGIVLTLNAEGDYPTLKQYLKASSGDLLVVWEKITLTIRNQLREIGTQERRDLSNQPLYLERPIFADVNKRVSVFAMKKVYEQYLKAVRATPISPLPVCTLSFTTTMGMPCSHLIQRRLHDNSSFSLTLQDFHPQWHITLPQQVVLPVEPQQEFTINAAMELIKRNFDSWSPEEQHAAIEALFVIGSSSSVAP